MTYSRIVPFVVVRDLRADGRAASLECLYVNSKRAKGSPAARPQDHVIQWRKPKAPKRLSNEELYAKSQALLSVAAAAARARKGT